MTELTALQKLNRITSERYVKAAAAVDSVPLLAARVDAMLWWGRRMTMARRYVDSTRPARLEAGRVLACDTTPTSLNVTDDFAGYGIYFDRFGRGTGFNAYASDGCATEAEAWERWHDGSRRNITIVSLQGGGPGDAGPSDDEWIEIISWNERGVGEEISIGFDTPAYYEAWQERENRGYELAEKAGQKMCKAFAELPGGHHHQVSRGYRVRCNGPLAGDVCGWAEDHVETAARP